MSKLNEVSTGKMKRFMRDLFSDYAKCTEEVRPKGEFWDVVVLTTFDEDQKNSMQVQLDRYKKDGRIPKNLRIEVVSDPPNVKLGSGGSTLHCLHVLEQSMGQQLYDSKILIIHSGGSSQRLPSYSAQGKIFSPMPVKDVFPHPVVMMLDVKLALYLPFCRLMSNGVFVCGSDHIETYNFSWPGKEENELIQRSDFIGLAHPSSIEVGTGHGVYVLEDFGKCTDESMSFEQVTEVLQKPTEEQMRSSGAVFEKDGEEVVYSDSNFWMSVKMYKPLLDWYRKNMPLKKELCAYHHILPCLGDRNKEKWNKNMSTNNSSGEINYYAEMFSILKDTNMQIIVLNESRFTHFGTMKEYIENFCYNPAFVSEMNLKTNLQNVLLWKFSDKSENVTTDTILTMGCLFDENINLFTKSISHIIIEWSIINKSLMIEDDVIISNCVIDSVQSVNYRSNIVTIFGNIMYHTVPMRDPVSDELFYVTFAVNISADIKHSSANLSSVSYLGIPMNKVVDILKIDVKPSDKYSIWTMKLFAKSFSAAESFWKTHNLVNKVLNVTKDEMIQTIIDDRPAELFSMSNIIQLKDLNCLIDQQSKLICNR